jgi:hypothetical protein
VTTVNEQKQAAMANALRVARERADAEQSAARMARREAEATVSADHAVVLALRDTEGPNPSSKNHQQGKPHDRNH